MKMLRLAALAVPFVLVACGGLGLPGMGTMSMKVDGADWNAMSGTVTATSVAGLNSMSITGSNNAVSEKINTVTIALEVAPAAGTYTLGNKNIIAFAGASQSWKASSGTVTITRWDTQAEGTFEGTATPVDGGTALAITAGKFSTAKN